MAAYGTFIGAISLAEAFVGGILLFVSCLILYKQLPAFGTTRGSLPVAPYGVPPSSYMSPPQ